MTVSITHKTPTWQTYAVLAGGVLSVSMAAILIRLAQAEALPSLLIAAARLVIATLILTPLVLRRHLPQIRSLRPRDMTLIGVSGLFLALHFILWITSLEYTTVLVSVVLVTTSPLWSALLEALFLRSRITRLVLLGLLLAIAGGVIISLPPAGETMQFGSQPVLGSLMAAGGALAVAVYLVIGRSVRSRLPLLPYIWLVYGAAAVVASLALLLTGTPVTGYSLQGYGWMVAVGLIPQLLGHSAFNYALEYLSATYVGIATQLEPVGSAIMAFFVFDEIPYLTQFIGSSIILLGVIVASVGQNKTKEIE